MKLQSGFTPSIADSTCSIMTISQRLRSIKVNIIYRIKIESIKALLRPNVTKIPQDGGCNGQKTEPPRKHTLINKAILKDNLHERLIKSLISRPS